MTDRELTNLLRMVREIDDLEPGAADSTTHYRTRAASNHRAQPVALDRTRDAHDGVVLHRWSAFAAALIAACVGWLAIPQLQPARPVTTVRKPLTAKPVSASMCHAPMLPDEAVRTEHFQSTLAEPGVLLAILRSWSSECECLRWDLHEWENGDLLRSARANEPVDIAVNVSDNPPVEQVLLLAVARDTRTLPQAGQEAEDLLECLNRTPLSPGPDHDAATYASTVQGCLPPGVTVVQQPFVVRSH